LSDGEGTLFGRWSRRKRAVAERERPHEAVPLAPDETPAPEVEETEEEALVRLGLPAPDSLGEGDDFTGFMQSGVRQFFRDRALRRLWRTNPVLANLDGLNDYDGDFRTVEHTPALVATAYKVGRGFVKAVAEPDEEPAVADASAVPSAGPSSVRKPGSDLPEDVPEAPEEAASPEVGTSRHEPLADRASTGDIAAREEKDHLRPSRMRLRTDT